MEAPIEPKPNFKLAAIQIGDLLKYDTTVNVINRVGSSVFPFMMETFPLEGVTSIRATLVYNWMLTLFKQSISDSDKLDLLIQFLTNITPDHLRENIFKSLHDCGFVDSVSDENKMFYTRAFHAEIAKHSRDLFLKTDYFHAVFEACKAYNHAVKAKANSSQDGKGLMTTVWNPGSGVLKLNNCQTETERNIHEGVMFLSAGLMSAVRNPTAHEPALLLPIDRRDALDVLSFISYLFRQLDKSVYVPSQGKNIDVL